MICDSSAVCESKPSDAADELRVRRLGGAQAMTLFGHSSGADAGFGTAGKMERDLHPNALAVGGW